MTDLVSLGIDPSTKTGLVVLASDGKSYRLVYERKVQFEKLRGFERLSELAGVLIDVLDEFKPNRVVIEGYGYANANSLVTLVEVGTTYRWFLRQKGYPYTEVAPNALKKFVTGSGNAPKDKVMMHCFKRWGYEAPDNDLADAYGLAMIGLALMGSVSVTSYQKDALAKIQKNTLATAA